MATFNYTGTAGNDTFSGVSEGSKGSANGLAGYDTAVVNYSATAFSIGVSTTGVVTLTTSSGGLLQFSNFEKIQFQGGVTIDIGTSGNDTVNGTTGSDTLYGLAGNDTLDGKAGADKMLGAAGNDTYVVDNVGDKVYETTTLTGTTNAGGTDTVKSSVTFTLGNFVENLTLTGSGVINGTGNTLANTLTGNTAVNTLTGGAGNDILTGGGGKDILFGGTGVDTFLFNSALSATTNVDTIRDYDVSGNLDKIFLDDDIFKALGTVTTTTALASAKFWAGTAAHDADDRIIYNKATGALYYDADGNGAGAQVQFAVIGTTTHATLAAGDFSVVV